MQKKSLKILPIYQIPFNNCYNINKIKLFRPYSVFPLLPCTATTNKSATF